MRRNGGKNHRLNIAIRTALCLAVLAPVVASGAQSASHAQQAGDAGQDEHAEHKEAPEQPEQAEHAGQPTHASHAHGREDAGHDGQDDANAELGHLEFPTSTRSPQAQAAFERGMLWLHLFEDEHAVAEFQKAERSDPGFALAYWGEAMTHTRGLWDIDDVEGARAALAKLGPTPQARAAKAPTAREKAFLDAGEQLFGTGTVHERDRRFLAAAAALAKTYPHDDEAQLLHALALLNIGRGKRDVPKYLQAADISRRVLAHNPRHPGAAHYWIHGMDDPAHADGALEAARALAKIAPGAGHAQHMTSHIFMALGLWDDVIAANTEAMRVVDAQREEGQPPSGCGHYNEWLQYAYYQAGRHREAQRQLADCVREGGTIVAWALTKPRAPDKTAEKLLEYVQSQHQSVMAMRATSVVESPADRLYDGGMRLDTGDLGRLAAWDAFARGYAALHAGNANAARTELAALQAAAHAPMGKLDHEFPDEDAYLGILEAMLEGALATHDGRVDAGIAQVRAAAVRNDALPFAFGPPVVVKPPHELAGEMLLGHGRPQEALAEFDAALKLAPQRALSLRGRMQALQAMGDANGAAKARAALAAIWHGADADLPLLAEVHSPAAAVAP
jgi:tetratricopeptide (TPR) repeat protein